MNTLRCSRFIYLAIKPTVKRLFIALVIICIPLISSVFSAKNSPIYVGISALFTLCFLSAYLCIYTLYTCDKIPQLYIVLPQRKGDFVKAVYFNYLLLILGDLVIGLAAYLGFYVHRIPDSGFFYSSWESSFSALF